MNEQEFQAAVRADNLRKQALRKMALELGQMAEAMLEMEPA